MRKVKSSGLFLIKNDRELTSNTACGLGKTNTQITAKKPERVFFRKCECGLKVRIALLI